MTIYRRYTRESDQFHNSRFLSFNAHVPQIQYYF